MAATEAKPSRARVAAEVVTTLVALVPAAFAAGGGAVLLLRFRSVDLPAAQSLATAGAEGVLLTGFGEFGFPAVIGAVLAVAAVTVQYRFRRFRFRRLSAPLTTAAVFVGATTAAFAALAASGGAVVGTGGLDVGVVTIRDTAGEAEIVAQGGGEVGPDDLPTPCTRQRPDHDAGGNPRAAPKLYKCAGYYVGTKDGYIVLGGDDRLVWFSANEVLQMQLLPGEDYAPFAEDLPEPLGPNVSP